MATLAQHNSLHAIPVSSIANRVVDKLQYWIEVSHQRRQLANLDRDQLLDIGIDRAEAAAEARKPFWK